jgi:hypothetical protein
MDFKNKQKLAPENGGSQSLLKADQTEKLIQHLSEITDVHTHQIVALYYAAILMPFFVRR